MRPPMNFWQVPRTRTLAYTYTLGNYRSALNHFFKFIASQNNGIVIDPDTMLRQMKPDQIFKCLLSWMMHLKKVAKQDFSSFRHGEVHVNTVHVYYSNVKAFFDYYDITLSWKKLFRFLPEKLEREFKVYSKDEVIKILSVATPRERAIVLLLASSEVRATALLQLKLYRG